MGLIGVRKFGYNEAQRTLDALREGGVRPTHELGVIVGAVAVGLGIPNTAAKEADDVVCEQEGLAQTYQERSREALRSAEQKIKRIRARIEAIVAWLRQYLETRRTAIENDAVADAKLLIAKANVADEKVDKAREVAELF